MSSVHVIGIVGSLRASSVNGALARAAVAAMPDGSTLSLHDVRELPLYDGDAEEAGPPDAVLALREAARGADGIVLFSPEYNSSLPAVTKNVIDWLSRDPSSWEGTGITMVTISPGGRAGQSARDHFSAIMPRQATRAFDTHGFGYYRDRLDETGDITDPETGAELADFLARFVDHCRS
jgi:chromate reductase